ncbi:MAG: exonuclease domain-containing protein [Pseudomonadota bacterium]
MRFAAFFTLIALGGSAIIAGALYYGWQRVGGAAEGYVIAAIMGALGLVGLVTWVAVLFDENVARPILSLAGDLQARAATDLETSIDQEAGRYLANLAPAVSSVNDALGGARRERDAAIEAETQRVERDKALLATLIRELSEAVLVVSPQKRLLLFNDAADALMGPLSLDRPISRFLDEAPIARFLGTQAQTNDGKAVAFISSVTTSDELVTGTVSDFSTSEGLLGHVLVCQSAQEELSSLSTSSRRRHTLLEQVRRPAMNIGGLLDVIDLDIAQDNHLKNMTERIRSELTSLAEVINSSAIHSLREAWPREVVRARELPVLANEALVSEATVWCDVFFTTKLMETLRALLREASERRNVVWGIGNIGDARTELTLTWEGEILEHSALDDFLNTSLPGPYSTFTTSQILEFHKAEIWLTGRNKISFELPRGSNERSPSSAARRQFFDFPEFVKPGATRPLSELSFVIFDTETTGLDTERDDVVQVAGVRMLRGQIMEDEDFDLLVDPGRPIPAHSTEIHGITNDMVKGAPHFPEVANAFAEYTDDAVLVAHNASFDRAFLDRVEASGGPNISNAMLCTARLSLALDPHLNDHTLDAIADRYGVEIRKELRHTALGDARATAKIFQRMLPMLQDRDVGTLEAALDFQKER